MRSSKSTIGLIAILVGTLAWVLPLSTQAQEPVPSSASSLIQPLLDYPSGPRYSLPDIPSTQSDGEPVKCLNTSQWKTVILITNEFHGLYDWRLEVHSVLRAQQDIVTAYELKMSSYEESLKIHASDRTYLTTRLDKEKAWALKLERSKGLEILAWKIVAGLELVAIVAMSVTVVVKN